MSNSASRWTRSIQLDYPELALPSRSIMHIAKRDRFGRLVSDRAGLNRRTGSVRRRF